MIEEEKNPQTKEEDTASVYLDAINQVKENSVSKEEYNKVVAERDNLVKASINGWKVEKPVEKPKKSIDELSKNLMLEGQTNLEYWTTSLELRDRVLEEQGRDLYIPVGSQYHPDDNDVKTAQKVARIMKDLVEEAEGDDVLFNSRLQQILVDTPKPKRK